MQSQWIFWYQPKWHLLTGLLTAKTSKYLTPMNALIQLSLPKSNQSKIKSINIFIQMPTDLNKKAPQSPSASYYPDNFVSSLPTCLGSHGPISHVEMSKTISTLLLSLIHLLPLRAIQIKHIISLNARCFLLFIQWNLLTSRICWPYFSSY